MILASASLLLAFADPIVEDVLFPSAGRTIFPSGKTAAYRVCPAARVGKPPGVLFLHWYSPEDKDSNRTQFLEEAKELARAGACSLLVETLWSKPEWFRARDREHDAAQTQAVLAETRRALAYLRRFADGRRLAFVGHDFGAMAGAAIAGQERAVQAWVLMAGTPQWGNWYLLGWRGADAASVQARTAHLDPVPRIARGRGAYLFQFGEDDRFVPRDKALEFAHAAPEPKETKFYRAGHGLNDEARRDRVAWIKRQLGLR